MIILNIELDMGVKPGELRHLIGRLGEFHGAINVKGTMALGSNQKGYDIECGARRISVKTTSQNSSFMVVNDKTLNLATDLMFIKFDEHKMRTFSIIFCEPVDVVKILWRRYPKVGKFIQYELYMKDVMEYTKLKKAG